MKTKFTYIRTGILEVCENARISCTQVQKVELESHNAKKRLYLINYPDSN